ncbi:hypothetical protein IWX88_000595 [Frigoribacterium sp. CG_9.8]|nr:hypothetical protein [Frigoribacterium sp. CG_9.8]
MDRTSLLDRTVRIVAFVVLFASFAVLVIFHWIPALRFLPVGGALLFVNKNTLSGAPKDGSNNWPK